MLTDTGANLLIEFTDKTGSVIVNRGLSESDHSMLNSMLKEWAENPTKKKETAIINKFAADMSLGYEL